MTTEPAVSPPAEAPVPARPGRPPLELLVFAVGIATLGAEIAAARLMAPFFGASTIVWANTIAIVLVALSIGYWFGGRMADRHPSMRALCGTVLAASVLMALVPLVADPFLSLSVEAFDSYSVGDFAGSLFGVLALVAIPVVLLGAVSPWAVRLKLANVESSGEVAGRLYAIGKSFDKAVAVLKPAVEKHPDSADASFLLAEAYLQTGKYEESAAHFRTALRLDPKGKAEAHLRLAALLNAAGKKGEAAAELKQFLDKNPNHPNREKFEEYIRQNRKR